MPTHQAAVYYRPANALPLAAPGAPALLQLPELLQPALTPAPRKEPRVPYQGEPGNATYCLLYCGMACAPKEPPKPSFSLNFILAEVFQCHFSHRNISYLPLSAHVTTTASAAQPHSVRARHPSRQCLDMLESALLHRPASLGHGGCGFKVIGSPCQGSACDLHKPWPRPPVWA